MIKFIEFLRIINSADDPLLDTFVEYERFHAPHILSFYFTLQLTSPASLDCNLDPFIHELSLPLR
jgi:hypothetical protein